MSARILVIDDIAANRRLLEAKLSREFYVVETAASGREALTLVARTPPDLVLLDVMMPEMSGYEVCRKLKADPQTAHIPVIMITALSEPADKIRALQVGADDFLAKPPNDIALFARVRSLTRLKMLMDEVQFHRQSIGEMAAPGLTNDESHLAESGGADILLIADDDAFVSQVQDILAADHHRLQAIGNRADAEAWVDRVGAELVLVTAQADTHPALHLCARLKAGPTTRHVPILMITLDEDGETNARALDLGVQDYITRPLERAELRARVRTLIRRHRYTQSLRSLHEKTVSMAMKDALTGLYNRRYLEGRMTPLLEERQQGGCPFSLMVFDLDHFKRVNDTHGHAVGDDVLRALAGRVSGCLRDHDVLARFGGEEFIVLLPETGLDVAVRVAERVRKTVETAPMAVGGSEGGSAASLIPVTISIGVTEALTRDRTSVELIERADKALYDAKKAGRNCVVALDLDLSDGDEPAEEANLPHT